MLQRSTVRLTGDEIARRLAAFERNGHCFELKGPYAIRIDRDSVFQPEAHFGAGWAIWRGSATGDGLKGPLALDAAAIALPQIDFQDVSFEHFIGADGVPIDGEQRLERIVQSGCIALDAKVGEAAVAEPHQATLRLLYDAYRISRFELAGTVLRRQDGKRFHACVERLESGLWRLGCVFVAGGRHHHDLMPVIAL